MVEHLQIGDRKIPLVKLVQTKGGTYVVFRLTDSGLHISHHPGYAFLHLKDKTGNVIAEIDLEQAKQLEEEDVKSLFRYPRGGHDIFVVPVASVEDFQFSFENEVNFAWALDRLFRSRVIYVMRARRFREFFEAKPGNHFMVDPVGRAIFFQFEGNSMGPLRLTWKRPPGNKNMQNLFSIAWGIMNYHSALPENKFQFLPPEHVLMEWRAVADAILSQVKMIRWKKGGIQREIGAPADYPALAETRKLLG